jgi:DNA polymerase
MITADFETRGVVDLTKMGATRYATDKSTQVLCLRWAYDDEEEVHLWHRAHFNPDRKTKWCEKSDRPDELIERIKSGELFEAHNAKFEFLIWNNVLTREDEFPEFDVKLQMEQMRCSAAKASCLSLRRKLGDAANDVGLSERKDTDGQRLINKLSKPMARRKLPVGATNGLPFKTALAMLLVAEAPNAGDRISLQKGYAIARGLLPEYKSPPTSWQENVRDILGVRYLKAGFYIRVEGGVYERTAIPMPDKKVPKFIGELIDDTPKIEFCEEEVEHKRNWDYCAQDVRTERALSKWCDEQTAPNPPMTERELDYWFMDFRMNMHGVRLDTRAAKEAIELCAQEVTRLDAEMNELTGGAVLGGSKRIPFRKWANERLVEIGAPPIPDTKADTLSFRLFGVPTKAAEEAKAARKDEMEAKWRGFGDKGAQVKRAFEICLEVNRSSVAKFRQMVGSVAPDGRLHDIMLYNGADRTGRWSGQGVQPHNFVRGYMQNMGQETPVDKDHPELGMKPSVWDTLLTLDLDYITLIEGPALPALAKACRGALIASEGYELYAADFKAIEARKLAWMANCESQLNLFRSGGDPYLAMACAIYNREITKKDKAERQLGKKAVLGLGYNMGWEKFQATVLAEEGIWLDDKFCKRVVNIYRKITCPEMPILWKAIEQAAILATQNPGEEFSAGGDPLTGDGSITYFTNGRFLHCRLPSGRLLAYLDPEVHTKINYRFAAKNERGTPCLVTFPAKMGVPMNRVVRHAEQMAERQRKTLTGEPPESFTSPHLSFMGRHIITKEWKRLGTHGGTLTENADQASSRDLLAEAMWRVDQHERFDLLLSIHDEVIAEAPIGTMPVPEFEAMVSQVPPWAATMPVEAEGWCGPRLRK